MDEKRISVAMAVYNGERYIAQQIDSILRQLSINDELVISYNNSSDNTWNVITKYSEIDNRVKCFKCEEVGVIANFENAIYNCSGEIICLSDQDDLWAETKVRQIRKKFEDASKLLLLHNCSYINKDGLRTKGNMFEYRHARKGILKNLVINCYQGCCMAFTKDLIPLFLPIPRSVPMHDQWFGLVSEIYASVMLIDEELILFRRRDDNTSGVSVRKFDKIKGICSIIINLLGLKNKKGSSYDD